MKVSTIVIFLFALCALCPMTSGVGSLWGAPQGKLVVAQGSDPPTLDPLYDASIPSGVILNNIYDCLVRRVFKDGRIQQEPMLATSWEMVNNTTWIFHLRRGVKFHNGEDFNAEAVKYNFERVLKPGQKFKGLPNRRRYYFDYIESVDVMDPFTVKITTKTPIAFFIVNLGWGMPIVPPKYTAEKGDAFISTHPVGTGPFKFVRWVKDGETVLEANESYWGGPPGIKTLIFRPIPEDSIRLAALMGGDVDIAKNVPIHLVSMIKDSNRAKVITTPGGLNLCVQLNSVRKGSPLQDKRVRQAINYGVDKESIVKHVLEGYGIPMASPLNPAHFGYNPNLKPYPFDPEKAKALLKEAGYGNGLDLTFDSPMGRYAKDKEVAEAIVGQLAKVGINIKLKVHEWGSYSLKIFSPEGADHMNSLAWAASFDADSILVPLFYTGQTLSRYSNKQFDSLLDQARSTMDPKRREKIYHDALDLIYDDAASLFFYQGVDIYGVSNRVQNWKPTPDEAFTMILHGAVVKD